MLGLQLEGVQKGLEEVADGKAEPPLEVGREDDVFSFLRAGLDLSERKSGLNSWWNPTTILQPLDFFDCDVGALPAPAFLNLLLLGNLDFRPLGTFFLFHLDGDHFIVRHRGDGGRKRPRYSVSYVGSAKKKEARAKLVLSARSMMEFYCCVESSPDSCDVGVQRSNIKPPLSINKMD